MPQLIAMIIVVVGAMIYMFQTFGGTGDKIEGIAQKTSIITEINNIKDGVKIAAKSGQIAAVAKDDQVNNLAGLANLSYFAEQINTQLSDSKHKQANVYNAISFGGGIIEETDLTKTTGNMEISLVAPTAANNVNRIPGIFVDFSKGNLKSNAAFLESQISNDLQAVAYIDRSALTATAKDGVIDSAGSEIEKRTPAIGKTKIENGNTVSDANTAEELGDGKFIIYFKDFGSDEVVQ